jgi:hypothetical protein
MTRREIEDRVTQFAAELEGAALVDAVRRFADGLSGEEREVLGEVLLERGREQGAEQYAEMTERMRAARWRVIVPPARERPGPP